MSDDYKLLWEYSEKRLAGANDWAMSIEAELVQVKAEIERLCAVREALSAELAKQIGRAERAEAALFHAKGGTQ